MHLSVFPFEIVEITKINEVLKPPSHVRLAIHTRVLPRSPKMKVTVIIDGSECSAPVI
jgi:hypothetical protein